MRKEITKLTAISMAFMLMLTGCSLGAKEKDISDAGASTETTSDTAAASSTEV